MAAAANAARAESDPELRRVYEQILRDPTNARLNFLYARLAIDKGELRKAIAAYERILAKEPDNEEAKLALQRVRRLLQPELTTGIVMFGAQYESNPAHYNFQSRHIDDLVLFTRGQVTDERRIGRQRWRTEGDIFANWHKQFSELDFGNIGARTGPIFDVTPDWRIRPALGLSFAWLDRKVFFTEPAASLEFESDTSGPLKSITLRGAYDFVGDAFTRRNAYQMSVNPRFAWPEFAARGGLLIVNPFYRYNGVVGGDTPGVGPSGDPFPLRYHQFGNRVDYFYTINRTVTVGVNVMAEYRRYSETVVFQSERRQDALVSPGAQLVLSGLIHRNSDIVFSYQFEKNFSTDAYERYDNHIAGVWLLWRF
jgi:hypothetical protein